MIRRASLVLLLSIAACGHARTAGPAPTSVNDALALFLNAVKANDLTMMGKVWGTERGAAVSWMKPQELKERLSVIQKYLDHTGYRIVDGPIGDARAPDQQTFHVELQRQNCNVVVPIDLVRTHTGGWIVKDPHLEAAGNPAKCPGQSPGTGH
ncbi:MAG TPA: hypothetical protein VI139_00785 [Gemmatimonadales bacterium]